MEKNKLIMNLEKKGYEVMHFGSSSEAVEYMIGQCNNKTIGIGGSQTVKEMGLTEALMKNNAVYWHWIPGLAESLGGVKAVLNKAAESEIYISSVNAIAETGEMINIDGTGNRIASNVFGHDHIYFVIGENKISENFEKAMWRARNVAAPKNAQRLKVNTPCAKNADKCYDCNSSDRICNGVLILERPMGGMKATVVLIDEDLGA